MAAISQTMFSNEVSWIKIFLFLIRISLKFVPKGPVDNESALVQVMAWRRTRGDELIDTEQQASISYLDNWKSSANMSKSPAQTDDLRIF